MNIIKLNAIDSSNSYLRMLCSKKTIEDLTVVVAKHQTNGRGQMGTVWQAEQGKNLTCSVFKQNDCVSIDNQFYISMVSSLAIIKTLQNFQLPKLYVKWPNDILSEQKKICGILIENIIKNNDIEGSVIGIGLNVNQTQFRHLPQASSILNLTGRWYYTDEVLSALLKNLKHYFLQLNHGKHASIKRAYEALLFRKNKPSTFKDVNGKMFSGYIKGVNENGNLQVLLEDGLISEYAFKEIQLLY
ncbi:MAG: biotin--[acetyl-CoA-carboxylase] ligase [Flavobacteriaceae bacterium]|nr:biotin--[acetyl-CoA-carboxylase] ligase [Flavobacteriaceae bacterium]